MILLGDSNHKTEKGLAYGFRTWTLALAPATEAGGKTVCKFSTAGCRKACIYRVGRGPLPNVVRARVGRTRWYQADPESFIGVLGDDMRAGIGSAIRHGLAACFRLNTFSDVPWEEVAPHLFEAVSCSHVYDYTKDPGRALRHARGDGWPPNYHITFSRSGTRPNERACREVLDAGGNVSVVFRTRDPGDFPRKFWGVPVIDGDAHDLRFLDKRARGRGPVIVGLTAKGPEAMNDKTGFVVDVDGEPATTRKKR